MHDVAELALAAGLAHEPRLDLVRFLAHGLAVGDLRLADVGVDRELALEAVDDDVEVQLAHAGDDGLAGLVVVLHDERGVLVGELRQPGAELVLVGLGLRLDRDRDDRDGERDRFSSTTGLSGSQIVSPVVECFSPTTATMSPVYAASLSSRWFACICRMRPMRSLRSFVEFMTWEPLCSTPRVHAQVGEPPDVGVAHDLERERGERLRSRRARARRARLP